MNRAPQAPLALLVFTASLLGCAGGSVQPTAKVQVSVPVIETQPATQSVPMGLAATYSVTAGGTGLQYQWSKNGVPIAGATSSSYTTPATAFSDTGAQYTVTITNSAGSVTSTPAALTVTARAPIPGDLRFQQVAAASTVYGYNNSGGIGLTMPANESYYASPSVGTPLTLFQGASCGAPAPSPQGLFCSMSFLAVNVSADLGLTVGYSGDSRQNLQVDLQSKSWPGFSNVSPALTNAVVTSLILDGGQFEVSWMQSTQQGTYDVSQQIITPDALASAAAQEGARGRVITAVSYFDNAHLIYLSYGWSGDSNGVYETTVQPATLETAPTVAAAIAQQGYIITAMGGSIYTDSLFIVGTRVQGDTMPRPFITASSSADQLSLYRQGYAVVGKIDSATGPTILGER